MYSVVELDGELVGYEGTLVLLLLVTYVDELVASYEDVLELLLVT